MRAPPKRPPAPSHTRWNHLERRRTRTSRTPDPRAPLSLQTRKPRVNDSGLLFQGSVRLERMRRLGHAVLPGQSRQRNAVVDTKLGEQARLVRVDRLRAEAQSLGD